MALPTGTISMSQVNTELSRSANATISLGEAAVRNLAGRPSGSVSMNDLRGKSAYTAPSISVNGIFGDSFESVCTTIGATATANISNGEPPFTVTWTRTSGSATPATATNTTSNQSVSRSFSQFMCPGEEASGSYSVSVTDNKNNTATTSFTYNFLHGGFGGGGFGF